MPLPRNVNPSGAGANARANELALDGHANSRVTVPRYGALETYVPRATRRTESQQSDGVRRGKAYSTLASESAHCSAWYASCAACALTQRTRATLLRCVLGDKRNRCRLAIAAVADSSVSAFGLAQILRKPILKRQFANTQPLCLRK